MFRPAGQQAFADEFGVRSCDPAPDAKHERGREPERERESERAYGRDHKWFSGAMLAPYGRQCGGMHVGMRVSDSLALWLLAFGVPWLGLWNLVIRHTFVR